MKKIVYLFQILIAIFLILLILIQQKRGGLWIRENYFQRRGIEKLVFYLTIGFGILFVILALLNRFLK